MIEKKEGAADAIEAKVNPDAFDATALKAFRALHPKGANFVVAPFVKEPYSIRRDGFLINICCPHHYCQ